MGKGNFIYLYCITKTKLSHVEFKNIGAYPIYADGIYAIVSDVSQDEFGEKNFKKNMTDMKWIEDKGRRHEAIIEKIMKYATVLPFKFGTLFKTKENAENLLKTRCAEFKNILANLDGKEEWGLKIYCDLKSFKSVLEKEDERIKKSEEEIASSSKGRAFFLKKKKSELVEIVLSEKISDYTKDCFQRLKRASKETIINRILPKEVTERNEDMILNAAFLISTKRIKEFENTLSSLKMKYFEKGIIFDYTGPWPAYNFCEPRTYGAKRT